MLIGVRHLTIYRYGPPMAVDAAMRLRLLPPAGRMQRVVEWSVTVNDEPVTPGWTNGCGVAETVWRSGQRIEQASILAQGIVETFDTAGITGFPDEAVPVKAFLRRTALTEPVDAIRTFAGPAESSDGVLATLHALCRQVHEAVIYRPGVTDPSTTASRVLETGAGVCQDFAHLFIAAARSLGIPCRYVAGYLHDEDLADGLHASHGWAEAFVDGLGWVGFDPTRRLCVTADYVRLSCGLDAFDAAPVRGVSYRSGEIGLSVDVTISAGPDLAQLQNQQQ